MIKAKVIVPFYFAKDKELYLDEERFSELEKLGKVEKVEDDIVITNTLYADDKEIHKEIINNSKVEKALNDKRRILSD